MERDTVQSIGLGTILTTHPPVDVEPFWREILLVMALVVAWAGVLVTQQRVAAWYFWRDRSHGEVLSEAILRDAYEEAGLDPAKHDDLPGTSGALAEKRRLSIAMVVVSWATYAGFLLFVYGLVWPQGDGVFWWVTAGWFAVTVGLYMLITVLERLWSLVRVRLFEA